MHRHKFDSKTRINLSKQQFYKILKHYIHYTYSLKQQNCFSNVLGLKQ